MGATGTAWSSPLTKALTTQSSLRGAYDETVEGRAGAGGGVQGEKTVEIGRSEPSRAAGGMPKEEAGGQRLGGAQVPTAGDARENLKGGATAVENGGMAPPRVRVPVPAGTAEGRSATCRLAASARLCLRVLS